MSRSRVATSALGVGLLLPALGACSDGSPEAAPTAAPTPAVSASPVAPGLPTAEPTPTATPSVSYTSSSLPVEPGALSAFTWSEPSPVSIGDWTLGDCPGPVPGVCARRAGARAAVVEVLELPLPDAAGADPGGALRAHADADLADIADDRARRCGAGYRVEPTGVEALSAAGTPVLRYGFRGETGDGQLSELGVRYAAARGDRLVLLSAEARAEGCAATRRDALDPVELARFLPVLDALVRTTPFPDGTS